MSLAGTHEEVLQLVRITQILNKILNNVIRLIILYLLKKKTFGVDLRNGEKFLAAFFSPKQVLPKFEYARM
jgi:hypothetical protein